MNNERELLELAAKAAGYQVDQRASFMTWRDSRRLALNNPQGGHTLWNAEEDDGDEARLEAAVGLCVQWRESSVMVGRSYRDLWSELYDDHGGDKQAARRYAGVRAAAEIGRAMP